MTQPEKSKTRRSHLLALFGSALCAPLIGIAVMAMVRDGWFGLDRAYATFPTSTVGLAAIISVIPFALVIVSGLFTRLLISVFLMPALYAIVARGGDRLEV